MSHVSDQLKARYVSPWSRRERFGVLLWRIAWLLLYRPTPKSLGGFRNWLLRRFGAEVVGTPFVHPTSRIYAPWRLRLEDRACLGVNCEVYNLGFVTLRAHSTLAQHAYLCAGSHDFEVEDRPLTTGPIVLDADCFVGARAIVLMNVTVGRNALVGAGAVVARDVPSDSVVVGNPARVIKQREPQATR